MNAGEVVGLRLVAENIALREALNTRGTEFEDARVERSFRVAAPRV
jgi:hypothetical protein